MIQIYKISSKCLKFILNLEIPLVNEYGTTTINTNKGCHCMNHRQPFNKLKTQFKPTVRMSLLYQDSWRLQEPIAT